MKTKALQLLGLLGVGLASTAFAQKPGAPKLTMAEIQTAEHVYKKTPQGDLLLHCYLPPGWKSSDKRPVVVFFFGGGWRNGSYTQFIPQAEYFASRRHRLRLRRLPDRIEAQDHARQVHRGRARVRSAGCGPRRANWASTRTK